MSDLIVEQLVPSTPSAKKRVRVAPNIYARGTRFECGYTPVEAAVQVRGDARPPRDVVVAGELGRDILLQRVQACCAG